MELSNEINHYTEVPHNLFYQLSYKGKCKMSKWEYITHWIEAERLNTGLENVLNSFGPNGYELVQLVPSIVGGISGYTIIFKKEIK